MRALSHVLSVALAALPPLLIAAFQASAAPVDPERNFEDYMVAQFGLLAAELRTDQLQHGGRPSQAVLRDKFGRYVETMSGADLAKTRQICAAERMPTIKRRAEEQQAVLPDAETLCLRALSTSARRDLLPDLYTNLALQAQGRSEFAFADDAKLLGHDESGRTTGSILRAAQSGATSYASVTGTTQQLPCALAFDAGFTWAFRNPQKPQPWTLNEAQASEIASACFEHASGPIAIAAFSQPATKAGLAAGAWFGRQQKLAAN